MIEDNQGAILGGCAHKTIQPEIIWDILGKFLRRIDP